MQQRRHKQRCTELWQALTLSLVMGCPSTKLMVRTCLVVSWGTLLGTCTSFMLPCTFTLLSSKWHVETLTDSWHLHVCCAKVHLWPMQAAYDIAEVCLPHLLW